LPSVDEKGKDVILGELFDDYPKPGRPVDLVIKHNGKPIAIGLAIYYSDRGGAQEDDGTGQYRESVLSTSCLR